MSSAARVGPLFLRFALAVTFIWAGAGKLFTTTEFSGQAAATLANLGVSIPTRQAPSPTLSPTPQGTAPRPVPTEPLPVPGSEPDPNATPNPDPAPPDETTGERPPSAPGPSAPSPSAITAAAGAPSLPLLMRVQSAPATSTPPRFTAEDFQDPVRLPRLYGLALLLNSAANPPAADDGTRPRPLLPAFMNRPGLFLALAWTAALSELIAGVLALTGLFTRFAAFTLLATMLTAMWLTEIGPAVQAGTAVLGFLPPYDFADVSKWSRPLWQLSLAMICLSLLFTGGGAMALERALSHTSPPPRPRPPTPPKA